MGSNYVQITVLENLCKLVHTESESGSSTGGPRLLGGPHSQLFFYYHFVSFTFYNPLLWVIWPNLTAEWHFYTAIYWNTWASYLLGYHMCTDIFVRHNILVNQLDSDNHNPSVPTRQTAEGEANVANISPVYCVRVIRGSFLRLSVKWQVLKNDE